METIKESEVEKTLLLSNYGQVIDRRGYWSVNEYSNEVIDILCNVLGGKCKHRPLDFNYLCIDETGRIKSVTSPSQSRKYNYEIMTVSEYWSKYPYRPGDEVKIPSVADKMIFTITSAKWINNRVEYFIGSINQYFPVGLLYPAKSDRHSVESKAKVKYNFIDFTQELCEDEVELRLGDQFELRINNGSIKVVKKY